MHIEREHKYATFVVLFSPIFILLIHLKYSPVQKQLCRQSLY